jgi:hypothetical protein
MSLLAALGLAQPRQAHNPAVARAAHATQTSPGGDAPPPALDADADTVRARPTGPNAKAAPKGTVDMPEDFGTVSVKKLVIGPIQWQGHKGKLYAFSDASGNLVTNGPRHGWKSMAMGNMMGGRIVHALGDLGILEQAWRKESVDIAAGTKAGVELLAKVQGAAETFLKRKGTDDRFRVAMAEYFDQLAALPAMREKIVQATHELESKLASLGEAVKDEEMMKVEEEIKQTEGDIADIKAEAQAIKDAINTVMSVGKAIYGFATAPEAGKAIDLLSQGIGALSGAIVDAQYAGALGALDAKLQASQEHLAKAKHEKMYYHVSAAQANVKTAISKCQEVDADFNRAVKKMTVSRATAQDRAGDTKETRIFGEAIARRSEQRTRVLALRGMCDKWLVVMKPLAENIPKVQDKYRHVSDWLDDIAAGDERLQRETPWSNNAEWIGNANSIELGDWIVHVGQVRGDCEKIRGSMDDKGAGEATKPYDDAVKLVEELLSESTVR